MHFRFLSGAWQGMVAVHQKIACDCWLGVDQKRQNKDLGIPENMTSIAIAAQGFRPYADRIITSWSRSQDLEKVKAQCPVSQVVPFNHHIGPAPEIIPDLTAVCQGRFEPKIGRIIRVLASAFNRILALTACADPYMLLPGDFISRLDVAGMNQHRGPLGIPVLNLAPARNMNFYILRQASRNL